MFNLSHRLEIFDMASQAANDDRAIVDDCYDQEMGLGCEHCDGNFSSSEWPTERSRIDVLTKSFEALFASGDR